MKKKRKKRKQQRRQKQPRTSQEQVSTYGISSIKRIKRASKNIVGQKNGKEIKCTKKCAARAKVSFLFFLIRPIAFSAVLVAVAVAVWHEWILFE